MKILLAINLLLLASYNISLATDKYLESSNPGELRIESEHKKDRSTLIVTEPKAKEAPVATEPYVKNDQYVVTFESTVGGESSTVTEGVKSEEIVIHQEVNTKHGTAYVPVKVPVNQSNDSRPMRGKSTYRIITRQ